MWTNIGMKVHLEFAPLEEDRASHMELLDKYHRFSDTASLQVANRTPRGN